MVTINIPPPPRTIPALDVDPGTIRETGRKLIAASAELDDAGSFVAGDARAVDWHGDSATTYRDELRPIGRQADAMSLALRSVGHRVDAHAEEMERLETARDDLATRRGELVAGVDDLERRASVVGPMTDEMIQDLLLDCSVVKRQVDAFDEDVATWAQDVRTEEDEMVRAFERVHDLEAVDRIYGGQPDPADGALDRKPPAGASPEEVNAWWDSLTQEERDAIIAASPGSIGNLDGIPASARDAANTTALLRDLADLGHTEEAGVLTDAERTRYENAQAAWDAREEIEGRYDPVTGEPITSQIYIYDPDAFDGDGRIAISAGDVDTADNVAVVTPGFGTDAGSAPYQADRAATLYESARHLAPGESNATMFWIGYDAPDNIPIKDGFGADAAGVLTEGAAEAGGARLADTIDGLRAGRDGDPAHLTAIGHSYGSTTTGLAAQQHGLDVDDIVFVGSPGVGGDTDHASDTGIDPEHVWAGANSRDPITYLGNHGAFHGEVFGGAGLGDDPAEDDFGANRFQAEDVTRPGYPDFGQHSLYFEHDTEALHNISQIVNGNYDDVQQAEHNYDPWYAGVQDPELDREPEHAETR